MTHELSDLPAMVLILKRFFLLRVLAIGPFSALYINDALYMNDSVSP